LGGKGSLVRVHEEGLTLKSKKKGFGWRSRKFPPVVAGSGINKNIRSTGIKREIVPFKSMQRVPKKNTCDKKACFIKKADVLIKGEGTAAGQASEGGGGGSYVNQLTWGKRRMTNFSIQQDVEQG